MKLQWQISAGELFELVRPLALVVSALLSTWVLASARRHFRLVSAAVWALGTFLLPFIVLPVYLIARLWKKRIVHAAVPEEVVAGETGPSPSVKFRFLLPAAYGLVLLSSLGIYFYRDYHTVDAHLARASQAKVMNNRTKAIREYRAALKLENNPHIHKLLGMELAEAQQWADALGEFRAAELGGEPDDSLPYRIALALDGTGKNKEAESEFKKFLNSPVCTEAQPDSRCDIARGRVFGGSIRK